MNPYNVLNILPTNDLKVIRRAYIQETKKHHPDRGGSPDHFQLIQTAYADLKYNLAISRKTVYSVDVKFSLNDLLHGCIATVLLQIDHQPVAVEFVVPAWSFPGSFIEFQDNVLTPQRIRVRLLEITAVNYTRIESDVVIQWQINSSDALKGINVDVINFDNSSHNVKIPPNTTASSLNYCISGEGFFSKTTKTRGDLHVIINIQG